MTLRELLKHKVDLYDKHIRQLDTGGFDSLTVSERTSIDSSRSQ
jgi:hypothetical protein